MATTKQLSGEVVHVSKERKMFQGKDRLFVTVYDAETNRRYSLPLSPKQVDRFDMDDLLQVGKKVHVEIEFFKKDEEWTDSKGKKTKYANDGRKILTMTALSSFEIRSMNIGDAKKTLVDIEDIDLMSNMATVLAGMK